MAVKDFSSLSRDIYDIEIIDQNYLKSIEIREDVTVIYLLTVTGVIIEEYAFRAHAKYLQVILRGLSHTNRTACNGSV